MRLAAENKALARAWADGPLNGIAIGGNGKATKQVSVAMKLVEEATEYFVLSKLSLHLNSHFANNSAVDESEIVTVGRREIPAVLLENRFLELFSKPMEEREAFSTSRHKSPPLGRVVFATGSGGSIFDLFELELPRGAKVDRINERSIVVRTHRFSLRIDVHFDGFLSVFPIDFDERYLGNGERRVDAYKISVELNVKFNLWSLFSATGWQYYQWLDSFVDQFSKSFAFEEFLDDIGWSTALTVSKLVQHGRPGRSNADSRLSVDAKPPESKDTRKAKKRRRE